MRVLIHDYGGYAFSLQLARQLARRGFRVHYVYSESTQKVKRGDFSGASVVPGLSVQGVTLAQPFRKYNLLQRRVQESEHGRLLAEEIRSFHPEVVLSANTPLDAQRLALSASRQVGARFVFWFQDAIGLATDKILRRRIPLFGGLVGRYYQRMERDLVRQSDAVILISEDFYPLMDAWGVARQKLRLVPNWAPYEEISPQPKDNPWAQAQGLDGAFCFLYAGILGWKHNPERLLELAQTWRQAEDRVRVVVVSEGPGADWLAQQRQVQGLDNLLVLPFQPQADFANVLAAADVLVSVLGQDAGVYSVPSKVLSYLCAARPLLLAIEAHNAAARLVSEAQAGLVVPPYDRQAWLQAARQLYEDAALRRLLADGAQACARRCFDIDRITATFEAVIVGE